MFSKIKITVLYSFSANNTLITFSLYLFLFYQFDIETCAKCKVRILLGQKEYYFVRQPKIIKYLYLTNLKIIYFYWTYEVWLIYFTIYKFSLNAS